MNTNLTYWIYRQQPWSTYALHIATFTSLAFVFDPLILLSCWFATENLDPVQRKWLLIAEIVWMFGFTKIVKLVGLFRRNPRDIIYLPVSIIFGYFHGLIKLYALFTLNMVSSRGKPHRLLPDYEANDTQRRHGEAGLMRMSTTSSVFRNTRSGV
jgi:hypothetical protein